MNYLRKELYQLIKSDESIFDFIQESSLDGLWYWDLENMEEEWMNPKFWTTLGYDPTKMPHKAAAWQDIIFPKDLSLAVENIQKHLADPNYPYDQEVRYRHKDGSTVWIRCRGLAIRDKSGKPTRVLGAHTDITLLKRKEQLLLETNRVARVGAWELDLRNNTVFWSEITKEIHEVSPDFTPDLATGINFYKEGISRETITKCIEAAISAGDSFDVELQIITAKNKEVWVRAIGQSEFQAGECKRVYGVFQDIENRKQAEKKLQESEEQFRQTFEQAVIGMTLVDKKGTWIKVNDSFCELVGYSRAELLESGYKKLVHPDDLKISNEELTQFAKGEIDVYLREKRYIHKKGHQIYLIIGVSKVLDQNGRIKQFVAQYSDITERKLAEQKLVQSELQFRETFENAIIGLGLVNKLGEWTTVNNSFCKIVGYTRTELKKLTFRELTHPEDLNRTLIALKELAMGKRNIFFQETRFIHKNEKTIWLVIGVSKVTDKNGEVVHYVAQYSDVTAQKEAAEKARKYSILEAKSKEMEQFAYITSHDLREPLTTLKGYLNLLVEEFAAEMPEDAQDILQFTLEGANRMDELIHGLLGYSRLSQVKSLENVDCNKVIKDVLADLHDSITKNEVEFKIASLPNIKGYPLEVKLLFQNLISNAIKFRKKEETPIIKINYQAVPSGWKFTLQDNGIGIESSESKRIFYIFQRLHKQAYEGTGIGLANCKKIVELHNGEIWVESTLGKGSTFHFTLLMD